MKEKICVITGSSSGIGLATAKEFSKMGATTILVARDESRGKVAVSEVIDYSGNDKTDLFICDFSSQSDILGFTESIKRIYGRLDVLINNVGMISNKRIETNSGIELTFAVNHLGYFITTSLLLDMLIDTPYSRIVVVSSDLHFKGNIDFDDLMYENNYNGFSAYCNSKLANLLFTYKMNKILKKSTTTINALHPGVVKTKFGVEDRNSSKTFSMGRISPEEGARSQIYLGSSPKVQGISGKYFNQMRMEKSSIMSYDETLADNLWQKSIEYSSVLYP